MNDGTHPITQADAIKRGIKGRCPRCGKGRLFAGMIKLAPRCTVCDLDYGFADAGDGPAVFAILLVGFMIVGLALWAQVKYAPPVWLLMLLFTPVTVLLCLLVLRWTKGILVVFQFNNNAHEGRLGE